MSESTPNPDRGPIPITEAEAFSISQDQESTKFFASSIRDALNSAKEYLSDMVQIKGASVRSAVVGIPAQLDLGGCVHQEEEPSAGLVESANECREHLKQEQDDNRNRRQLERDLVVADRPQKRAKKNGVSGRGEHRFRKK